MDKSKSNGSHRVSTETRGSSKGAQTKEANRSDMQSSQLMKLFEEELKDIYWAEKALTKAIPKMIKNATSADLIEALENHLMETEEQVKRAEQVFELTGKKAVAKKCEAMEGLIKEAEEIMEECEEGAMRDAGIISAGQKVEHYEIASYGTLRQFAETLGLTEAAALLEETLNEEKVADEKLTEVALSAINVEASEEGEETKTKRSSK
jgi:ferritin-like metal-binding protein YciE